MTPSRWAMLLAAALTAGASSADTEEPPSDAPEGADHVMEAGDSLASGSLELGLAMAGGPGRSTERRRRVSFSERDFSGTVREGAGDPLAGGAVRGGTGGGEFAIGRLSPRWNRGLLLGSPGDPWQSAAVEGVGAGSRGKSGEGLLYRHGSGSQLLAGRFGKRTLAGGFAARGAWSASLLSSPRTGVQSSLGFQRGAGALEVALDRTGPWRADAMLARRAGDWRLAAAARGGSEAFRSLAEPSRSGPSRALALTAAGHTIVGSVRGLASAWRYRAGRAGARLALEIERELAAGGRWSAGFEEQHGFRGEQRRATGFRQGAWIEWSRPPDPIGIALRQEIWGARSVVRDLTRSLSGFALEARLPRGAGVSMVHCVYRVRAGDNVYLREAESDRVVLRALSGVGQRTRLDLRLPFARGTLRAACLISQPLGRAEAARWTFDWSRRSRLAGSTPK